MPLSAKLQVLLLLSLLFSSIKNSPDYPRDIKFTLHAYKYHRVMLEGIHCFVPTAALHFKKIAISRSGSKTDPQSYP